MYDKTPGCLLLVGTIGIVRYHRHAIVERRTDSVFVMLPKDLCDVFWS